MTDEGAAKALKQLRRYYRLNFKNGASDEAFLLWVEGRTTETSLANIAGREIQTVEE